MNQITLKILAIFLIIIVTSCAKQEVKHEDSADDTSFEEFLALFPTQSSVLEGINAENGKEFGENPEIDVLYLQQFLIGKSYLGKENNNNKFIDSQELTYRVVTNLLLNPHFHSLIISANEEGNPSNEWAYYLLNYTKEGKFIDGILLSYRNSYADEETTANFQQSEYRYVRFLSKTQLHFIDVSYKSVENALIDIDSNFMLTSSGDGDTQYFRESWYEVSEKGIFKRVKSVERDKSEAKP
jgi:hypothetical protein